MAAIDNSPKELETMFGMGTRYVLDFSNPTFADLVQTSIGGSSDLSHKCPKEEGPE